MCARILQVVVCARILQVVVCAPVLEVVVCVPGLEVAVCAPGLEVVVCAPGFEVVVGGNSCIHRLSNIIFTWIRSSLGGCSWHSSCRSWRSSC